MSVDPANDDESRLVQTRCSDDARMESKPCLVGLSKPAKLHHGKLGLPSIILTGHVLDWAANCDSGWLVKTFIVRCPAPLWCKVA